MSSVLKIAQKKISLCRFEFKRTFLKSVWKYIVAQQGLFYKTLLILSSSICLLYLFPMGGQFKYEFQKGRLWQYPSYYAPFDFSILKSGPVAGVGTSLLWSISYFFGGLFRSIMVKNIVRVFFFWLRYFDFLVPDSHNIDGASGVYFIGKKSEIVLSEKEIITYYNGSQ